MVNYMIFRIKLLFEQKHTNTCLENIDIVKRPTASFFR